MKAIIPKALCASVALFAVGTASAHFILLAPDSWIQPTYSHAAPQVLTAVDAAQADLPKAESDLIELAAAINTRRLYSTGFTPPTYFLKRNRPDIPRIRDSVRSVLANPPTAGNGATVGGGVCR